MAENQGSKATDSETPADSKTADNRTTDSRTADTADTADSRTADSGEAEVQAKVDEEEDQGFLGNPVDETPREHYTLPGVIAGKPTPETTRD